MQSNVIYYNNTISTVSETSYLVAYPLLDGKLMFKGLSVVSSKNNLSVKC